MRLSDLRNVGPTSEAMLVEIGVTDAAPFATSARPRRTGASARLRPAGDRERLQSAFDDVDWRELTRAEC